MSHPLARRPWTLHRSSRFLKRFHQATRQASVEVPPSHTFKRLTIWPTPHHQSDSSPTTSSESEPPKLPKPDELPTSVAFAASVNVVVVKARARLLERVEHDDGRVEADGRLQARHLVATFPDGVELRAMRRTPLVSLRARGLCEGVGRRRAKRAVESQHAPGRTRPCSGRSCATSWSSSPTRSA